MSFWILNLKTKKYYEELWEMWEKRFIFYKIVVQNMKKNIVLLLQFTCNSQISANALAIHTEIIATLKYLIQII